MKKLLFFLLIPLVSWGQTDYIMGKYLNAGLGYAPYDSPIQGDMVLTPLQLQLEAGVYLHSSISTTIGVSYFNEKSSQEWSGIVGQLGYRIHLPKFNIYSGIESWPNEPKGNNFSIESLTTLEVPFLKGRWDGYVGYQTRDGFRIGIKRKILHTPWVKYEWSDDEFSTFDLNGNDVDFGDDQN